MSKNVWMTFRELISRLVIGSYGVHRVNTTNFEQPLMPSMMSQIEADRKSFNRRPGCHVDFPPLSILYGP
jgi:hypothetical protein